MLTRRWVLSGLVAAPAVIAADKLMPIHVIPERYATVWGVGHDYEVIELALWKPTSAIEFGVSEHCYKFREITDWVYTNPVGALDRPLPRVNPTQAYFEEERRKLRERGEDGPPMWSGYDLEKAEKEYAARKESRVQAARFWRMKGDKMEPTVTKDYSGDFVQALRQAKRMGA
jgi:hypothetical protein